MTIRGARALVGFGMAVALAASCVSGQPTARLEFARGVLAGRPWTAVAFRTAEGAVCMEVVVQGDDPARLCELSETQATLWQVSAPTGTVVVATTAAPRAVAADVLVDDGQRVHANVAGSLATSRLWFIAVALPEGRTAKRVEVLDAAGDVIESHRLE